MAKKIMWAGSYGPDRSHDTLDTNVFDRKKDALTFAKRGTHWRVTRLEWADEWSKPKREDVEIGGPDIDKQIESVRMAEQARTMKRVSTGRALTLWRQQMRARHGSGGTMNPKKRKKKKIKVDFIFLGAIYEYAGISDPDVYIVLEGTPELTEINKRPVIKLEDFQTV